MIGENYVLSVEKAKEIIIDFLKDNFRQELISSVENILKNYPIHNVDEKTINETKSNKDEIYDEEHIGACATDKGIFLPKHLTRYYPDAEFDEDVTLSVIIHEYAHIFRKLNSEYGYMFEEGFVTMFAEACIAHYKIKKQMQEGKNVTQPEMYINSSWKYKKAESQVTSILYILNQHGVDIELLGEYIFGDENVFKQKCSQIFGERFSTYFDLANSNQDQYYNDYDFKEQNSEILLTDILKEYIVKNGLDLKKYSDRNNLLLYNRGSKTLAKGIVAAGESSFKETDKEEYKLFESFVRMSLEDEQQEKDNRINRIKQIINEKYSFSGKSREEIYSILESLCSDYIQRKNSSKKENIIFTEELKKTFTDIEEVTKKFIELRTFTISSSVFDGLNLENVSYLDITKCVSEKLEFFMQKQMIDRIRTIFENCSGKEDLISKINELKTYEQNIDINKILPNYSDFQNFVIEMQEYIPEKFTNEQEWNYQTLYNEMLNLYISRQEQQLLQDKIRQRSIKHLLNMLQNSIKW